MGPVPDIDVDSEIRRHRRHKMFVRAAWILTPAVCGSWIAFFGTSLVLLPLWAGEVGRTSLQAMTGIWRALFGLSLLSMVLFLAMVAVLWIITDERQKAWLQMTEREEAR
jgi:uncharacterized membrane protein